MTHHTDAERAELLQDAQAAGFGRIVDGVVGLPPAWWGQDISALEAFDKLRAARRAPAVPVPQETCVICGSDEPYTGTCGSNDPRALCKKPAPQPPEAAQLDDIGVVDMAQAVDSKEAAPVQLPEPVAAESRFTTFAGDRWGWCTVEHARAFGADKGYEVRYLYTEQQVRELLAANGIKEQST